MTTQFPELVTEQIFDTLSVLERHLGETIQAIHLFGSVVAGGLQPFKQAVERIFSRNWP